MTRLRPTSIALRVGVLLGALFVMATPALPQEARQDPEPPADAALVESLADPDVETTPPPLEQIVSTRLASSAVRLVRQLPSPTPTDYRLAALLLEEALELTPQEAELVRITIEAWHAAGDNARVIRWTRRLLELDPQDTVAQLRLISDRIGELQTAGDRQKVYERILGPQGSSLNASIRSRLALDSALLARDQGDQELFVERLTRATQLDPTNKDAAVLVATHAMPSTEDPLARVELLANTILADPIDRQAHLNLARELLNQGAYRAADRFYQRVLDLLRAAGEPTSSALVSETLLVFWALRGADALVNSVRERERVREAQINQIRASLEEQGEDVDQVPEYRFNPVSERFRLLAASAIGREEDAKEALRRLSIVADSQLSLLEEQVEQRLRGIERAVEEEEISERRGERARKQSLEQAEEARREIEADLARLRLWSGLELEKAVATFEKLRPQLTELAIRRFEGAIAALRGELERAVELLAPIAEDDVLARIALGLAHEARGQQREAVRQYAMAAQRQPGTQPGLWARSRLAVLLGEPVRLSEPAQEVEDYVAQLPADLDAMTQSARTFMLLEAEQLISRADPLDGSPLRIRLRNVGPIPLAVGDGAPLNSELLLTPRAMINGRQLIREVRPEVVSLRRRLRLMPGESIVAEVNPTLGLTGATIEHVSAVAPQTLRWRVTQGFRIDPEEDARYVPGLMGLTTETNPQVRRKVKSPGVTLSEITDSIRSAEGSALLEQLIYARYYILRTNAFFRVAEDISTARDRISMAIADRFATMTPLEQAYTALTVPRGWAVEETLVLDDAIAESGGELARLIAAFTRASSMDDRFLEAALESDDERTRAIAQVVSIRLESFLEQRGLLEDNLPSDLQNRNEEPEAVDLPGGSR